MRSALAFGNAKGERSGASLSLTKPSSPLLVCYVRLGDVKSGCVVAKVTIIKILQRLSTRYLPLSYNRWSLNARSLNFK
jgi:hypothetical protein